MRRDIRSREVVCSAIELVGDLVGADYNSGLGIEDALNAIEDFVRRGVDEPDRAARARMVYGLLGRAASDLSKLTSPATGNPQNTSTAHPGTDMQDGETPIGYVVRMMTLDARNRPHHHTGTEGPHN